MADQVPNDLKNRLKTSYDVIAQAYADKFTRPDDPIRLHYIELLLSELKTNTHETVAVLELGCGAGVPATKYLLETKEPLIHVTGNDLSTAQLELARSNLAPYNDRLKLIEGDMSALSFPERSFDAVTGFYSIIHLPREEQVRLIEEIARWLKPNGLFLANFAVEEAKSIVEERWLDQDEGWMYWSGFGEEGSVKMVKNAGFDIVVRERNQEDGDANFVWLLAKKK